MAVEVHLEPFKFPNFLKVKEWGPEPNHMFPVAHLSPKQAAAYWDELKPLFVKHCEDRYHAWKVEHPSGFENTTREQP